MARATGGRVLVALRHGQTEWNTAGRYQGHADLPMDPTGLEQVARVAVAIAELGTSGQLGPSTPVVVTSDMQRAVRTASEVAAALRGSYRVYPELREVDLGAWSGLTRAEAAVRFPTEFARWAAGTIGGPGTAGTDPEVRRGGGETVSEAGWRVATCIKAVMVSAAPASVVVVGHGTSLQAAIADLAAEGVVELDGEAPHLGNGQFVLLPAPVEISSASRPLRTSPFV